MIIDFHKRFVKQYDKLPTKLQQKFDDKLEIFMKDPTAPELNNHTLHGKYLGCRSINVTGNIRVIYEIKANGIRLLKIGSHSELYE
ncbi:MAG: type II toxin-antitoxin system mRNA interferase toxin, RelE/StbE family [Candidatus Paceibacterota bacterium]|jgi:addiction module RelE/StbE family toxin